MARLGDRLLDRELGEPLGQIAGADNGSTGTKSTVPAIRGLQAIGGEAA